MENQPLYNHSQPSQDHPILQPDFANEPTNAQEPINIDKKAKPGILTLIVGVILLIRGAMRMSDEAMLGHFGILMIVIGLGALFVYFRNRF